jgi:hypothetical protein
MELHWLSLLGRQPDQQFFVVVVVMNILPSINFGLWPVLILVMIRGVTINDWVVLQQ